MKLSVYMCEFMNFILLALIVFRCDMQELTSAQNKVEELLLALQLKEYVNQINHFIMIICLFLSP